MAKTHKNSNKVWLQFSKKQLFNKRTIAKKDSKGKPITLISIGLPTTSKYAGYYISVNIDYVKDSPFNKIMASTSIYEDATITIFKYNRETGDVKKKKISATELRDEFNSWKTQDEK